VFPYTVGTASAVRGADLRLSLGNLPKGELTDVQPD